MDALDHSIVSLLQKDGRMRYTEIVAQMFTGKTDPYECARRRGRNNVNGRGS